MEAPGKAAQYPIRQSVGGARIRSEDGSGSNRPGHGNLERETYDCTPERQLATGIGKAAPPMTMSVSAEEPIPGLTYRTEFVGLKAEDELLRHVDDGPWVTDMARRVQHHGWRYNYRARRVTPDSFIGPLPTWLDEIATELAPLMDGDKPDQVIVNEYEPGHGIAKHVDCKPCFGPVVAMISLGSDTEMDFVGPEGTEIPRLLRQRSLLVLAGPARTDWTHEIPKRRTDRRFGITRARRVSLTFRVVNMPS